MLNCRRNVLRHPSHGKTFEIDKVIEFAIPGVSADHIQPVGMRFSKDGKNAFVALGPSNRIAVVDADSFEVKDYTGR